MHTYKYELDVLDASKEIVMWMDFENVNTAVDILHSMQFNAGGSGRVIELVYKDDQYQYTSLVEEKA